jgi:hypothetical protein
MRPMTSSEGRPTSLRRLFREDRFLAIATAVLVICAWIPLFVTPFLPFADLHNNVGSASLLWDTAFGHGLASNHYHVQFAPLPYWTAYLFIAAVKPILGPLWAAKALCGLIVVLLPLGTMRLLASLGRSPRVGLWAFALSWDHNLYAGWVTYLLGMSIALFTLAALIECDTWKRALRILPFAALIAMTHLQALAFFLMAGGLVAIAGRDRLRKVGHYTIIASGSLVSLGPWLLRRIQQGPPGQKVASAFTFEWHTPEHKISSLYKYTLDNNPTDLGEIATAVAFIVIVLGSLFLAGLPRRGPSEGGIGRVFAIFFTAAVLYAFLPMAVKGPIVHWYTYPRYGSFILASLLLVPQARLRGRQALALAPGIGAALLMDYAVLQQFREFGKNARPFLEIIAAAKPDSSVLSLAGDNKDPACTLAPYEQFHAYIVATKSGYDGALFEQADNPLLYVKRLPKPGRGVPLSMEKHGQFYDYILVQGPSSDPFTKSPEDAAKVTLVREAGRWRLYSVNAVSR